MTVHQQKHTYGLEERVEWWRKGAEKDLATAESMLKNHRDWALFIGQLALEKYFKGLVLKNTKKTPPYIHELAKLAERAEIELTPKQMDELNQISQFNAEAKYPEFKRSLYELANKAFAQQWFAKIKKYAIWLQTLY